MVCPIVCALESISLCAHVDICCLLVCMRPFIHVHSPTWKEMAFPFGRWELASFNRLSLMLMVTVDLMCLQCLFDHYKTHFIECNTGAYCTQLLSNPTLACLIKIIIAVCWFTLVDLISLFGLHTFHYFTLFILVAGERFLNYAIYLWCLVEFSFVYFELSGLMVHDLS